MKSVDVAKGQCDLYARSYQIPHPSWLIWPCQTRWTSWGTPELTLSQFKLKIPSWDINEGNLQKHRKKQTNTSHQLTHLQKTFFDGLEMSYNIPGSSKCVKVAPFHQNMPKGRSFTYLEDPGISINIHCLNFLTFESLNRSDALSQGCQGLS